VCVGGCVSVCMCVCHMKTRPMCTVIINTNLLAVCHSGMFQPSESHLQGLR